MNEYAPVYPEPFTWETTFAYLLQSEPDKNVVEQLVEELKNSSEKTFREPIHLYEEVITDEDIGDLEKHENLLTRKEDAQGNIQTVKKVVGDGTHRVCAAYLADVREMLVSDGELDYDESPYVVYTTITFTNIKEPLSDDEFDEIFHHTRSIRISDTLWMTQGIGSYADKSMSIYWENYDESLVLDDFSALLHETVSKIFPYLQFEVKSILEQWDEEDEELESMWNEAEKSNEEET